MAAAVNHAVQNTPARERVLAALWAQEWMSWRQLSAPDLGGIRYGARVAELRAEGWHIVAREIEGGQGQEYRLDSLVRGEAHGRRVRVYLDEADAEAVASSLFTPAGARTALREALGSFNRRGK